jgi:hypothetical protein
VALSNVLYANSMAITTAAAGREDIYAAWDARVLQHLMLYPVLLGCVWLSLRIGWRPLFPRGTIQVLLALMFAVIASPALMLGQIILGEESWGTMHMPEKMSGEHHLWSTWAASAIQFLCTYGFALALVTGFAMYRRLRDSELRSRALEHELSAAQLATLRMQLSPHTLFNLLHTIRGQIGWDPPAAQAMVVQLADLLRRLLTAGEREFARLADEIEFVRLYLELQRQRFSDRLSIAVPAAGTLPAAWVPSLILQPLVENAVVHGLAGHEGPVSIRVEVEFSADSLCLRVVNTVAPAAAVGREGVGLHNVRERLAIQFGAQTAFSAAVGPDNVWIAEIRMPLLRDGPVSQVRTN